MKSKFSEPNQPSRYRRHSMRLFQDDSQLLIKKEFADLYMEQESSSASSSYAAVTSTATTSFTACTSSSCNTAPMINEANDVMPSSDGKKLNSSMPRSTPYSQQQNRNKASELFRTDYITAMKLGTETLTEESCLKILDPWKLEWEKGVQVPNGKYLSKPNVCLNKNLTGADDFDVFSEDEENQMAISNSANNSSNMPSKYLCPIDDKHFNHNIHEPHLIQRITNIQNRKLTDSLIAISKYEYDETDDIWLTKINEELTKMGLVCLNHLKFEKIMENFENQSFEMLKSYLDKLCLYKIEYDPTIVCDVCRSPDSDPTNEIVFCDGCNICVHQNCYGIETIPDGNWLCAGCEYGGPHFRPECVLCPNKGGALKPTKDFKQWCHVSCVLWTPEVTFGNTDKYEPVINISKIPNEKWLMKCSLCKYKKGCCVECSVNRCSNAFHITCAFRHNLRTTESTNDEGLLEIAGFCKKHSKLKRNEIESTNSVHDLSLLNYSSNATNLGDETNDVSLNDDVSISEERFHLALQSMNENERKTEIIKRLEILYYKFYYKVSVERTKNELDLQNYFEQIKFVYNYWKMKRRFNQPQNKPLINYRADKPLEMTKADIGNLSLKNSLFLDVRHRLEYLRNLCFVIKKREKKKEKYNEINRRYFSKLAEYLEKYKTPQLANGKQKQQTETWSSCRIRDMLQTKNEKTFYDYPEKWELYDDQIKSSLNIYVPFDNEISETVNIDSPISDQSSKFVVLKASGRQRTKSLLNNAIEMTTKETNIKDISINVLNNNNNTNNTNSAISLIKGQKSPNKVDTIKNTKFLLSNSENNETVNSEKRLLRSVNQESSRKSLQVKSLENDCLETSNSNLIEKTRLSISLKKLNGLTNTASKNKNIPDELDINIQSHLEKNTARNNSTRLKTELKEENKKSQTISINKKKRHNLEYPTPSSAKRHRPNEIPNNEHQQTSQQRFNLRTKSLIEK